MIGTRALPRTPAHVEPNVAMLGVDLAVTFLLHFGGAGFYVRRTRDTDSELAAVIGSGRVAALGKYAVRLPRRVPLVKPSLAAVLSWRGQPVPQIARTLRASDVSVKKWITRGWQ